jgi:hypothetical protein
MESERGEGPEVYRQVGAEGRRREEGGGPQEHGAEDGAKGNGEEIRREEGGQEDRDEGCPEDWEEGRSPGRKTAPARKAASARRAPAGKAAPARRAARKTGGTRSVRARRGPGLPAEVAPNTTEAMGPGNEAMEVEILPPDSET